MRQLMHKQFNLFFISAVLFVLVSYANAKADNPDSINKIASVERARLHPIEYKGPAVDFFDGALLGNGGLGAVVTTRPDAVVIRFGHNNVWDIRIAENNKDKIGTFKEIFEKVKKIPENYIQLEEDKWYREYKNMARENYAKPYPRPFPCGSILLGFDHRGIELLGHRLDISCGLCEIDFLVDEKQVVLQIFTDMKTDQLWMRLVDQTGNLQENIFDRVKIIPDPSTPKDFPTWSTPTELPQGILSFRQILPYEEPEKYNRTERDPKDRAFRLTAKMNSKLENIARIDWYGNQKSMGPLERGFVSKEPFVASVKLDEGLSSKVDQGWGNITNPNNEAFLKSFENSKKIWEEYWNLSGVKLEDKFLERTWYQNIYFLNCAVKAGVTCPGLFANWSYNKIGTAWHGDYHMNYNTQQPFWVTFSSNHVDKNLPYVELVEHLLPVSRKWAKEYYNLRGAYFPHSAYPVEMTMNPYPVPTWGWEVCETPWTVQGLWWHYLYTMDEEFLRQRAFVPIKEAVLFLVDYMRRPEARGPQWGDDKYHIFPTVPPELYGLKPGFKYNYDCLVDLTLTKFIFNAYSKAVKILGLEEDEKLLLSDVLEILCHFPEYPMAESKYGKVFVSVPDEHSEVVYNVPNSLMTVFPGEEHGLHSDAETYEILCNTFRNFQIEGGNELVFQNLQAARIGLLDLKKFKRQIHYCRLPNGTCTDMVLQVHGRYNDNSAYDFMKKMGIWFENFSLPVVINECLLQSYNGNIRLFPNWPKEKDAMFNNLRAVGAFLISSSISNGKVEFIDITSEAGTRLKIHLPWQGAVLKTRNFEKKHYDDFLEINTMPDERIVLKPL